MSMVCNFAEIVGNGGVTIGDPLAVWEENFDTKDRHDKRSAFLLFNVRGLTYTNVDVNVRINNKIVGKIHRYGGLTGDDKDVMSRHWYTQMIAIAGSDLKDGTNEVQIEAVGFPEATDSNKYDDFTIKNMVCFFHQWVKEAA